MTTIGLYFACPLCKDLIQFSDYPVGVAGHKVTCSKCRQRILVPSSHELLPAPSNSPAVPMTESKWLSSTDSKAMLEALRDSVSAVAHNASCRAKLVVSQRKLRLFACAYCHQVWHRLTDKRSRKAVEVAEKFADGKVTKKTLETARDDARNAWKTARDDVADALLLADEDLWDLDVAWTWEADWAAEDAWKAIRKAAKAVSKAAKLAQDAEVESEAAVWKAREAAKEAAEAATEAGEAIGGDWEAVAEATEVAWEAVGTWETIAEDAEVAWEAAAETAENTWRAWKAWKTTWSRWEAFERTREAAEAAVYCADEVAWKSADYRATRTAWDLFARLSGAQAALLRDIFGPLPFRHVHIDPEWVSCREGAVQKLAQAAYGDRSFQDGTMDRGSLVMLADALEKAGCKKEEILKHCRNPAKHVRGCWVIDLLLDKT